MNTKLLITILPFTLLFQFCKPKEVAVSFRVSENVACEQIDTVYIGVPLNMSMYQNELFIGDSYAPMIVHYNLITRDTDRFLNKGRGKGETFPPVAPYANPFGDRKLYLYSKQMTTMGFCPLDSLKFFTPLFTLPFGYFDVLPYEKDRYIAAGMFGDEYRYRVLNEEGTVIASFGDYPSFLEGENAIPINARAMFHHVQFVNSYSKKKLVSKSNYVVDIIDYSLDIANKSMKRILLAPYDYDYDGSNRGTWAQEKRGIVIGATAVACDDTYIYLLFNPGFVREENKGIKKEIWVMDWDGQPVKKLMLDIDVMRITADPYGNDHTVFGLAYKANGEDEYYQIVKIDI